MPKKLDVGRSNRTPAKHALMSNVFGQEVGVVSVSQKHRGIGRHVWIDLTAGDGVPNEGGDWVKNCSPGIAAFHATKASRPVDITLYEIQTNTFDRLIDSLTENLAGIGYRQTDETRWQFGEAVTLVAVNASGLGADVSGIRRTDAVIVSNDPNAITSWAMRPTFTNEIMARGPWCFRSITTMGCNVGGIKRLSAEDRAAWFGLIKPLQDACPSHRDLLLAAIEGDSSQWAYLLCEPAKWRGKVDVAVRTAFKKYGYALEGSWSRQDPGAFDGLKERLFLTRTELGAR